MLKPSVTQAPDRAAPELDALEGDIAAELGVLPRSDIGVFAPEGKELLFVGLELGRGLSDWLEPDAVARAVGEVLATRTPLGTQQVIVALFSPGGLPRTERGEPERRRAFELCASGRASCVAVYRDGRRQEQVVAGESAREASGAVVPRMREIWQEVLQRPSVQARDGFFALGGSSLAAAQVGARVQEQWGVVLGLSALFEAPTLEAFSARVEQRLAAGDASLAPGIARARRDAPLPLSSAQRQLWFLWQLDKDSPAYNLAGGLSIQGELHTVALQGAVDDLMQRHESLCTSFRSNDGEAFQHIDPSCRVAIERADLRARPSPAAEARALWARELQRPFELTCAPLLRVSLYRLGEREYLLAVTVHHVVADGWSMGLFAAELAHLYEARVQGHPPTLAALPIQFPDYAAWQVERLRSPEMQRQLGYWRQQLSGDAPELQLPSVGPRSARGSDAGASRRFSLPAELSGALRRLAGEAEVTLSMLLLAAFKVLLYRYSGQSDIWVGVPSANRSAVATEGLIGFFVNTQVFRTDLGGAPSFRQLLGRIKSVALGAHAHADVPFERVVEALNPQRSLAHNPLFQVKFTLQIPGPRSWTSGDVTFTRAEPPTSTTHFDLGLDFTDWPEAIEGCLTYSRARFDTACVERMVSHLGELLSEIVRDPDQRIDRLSILPEQEREVLGTWAQGERVCLPRGALESDAIERFVELSKHQPLAPAVAAGEERWSYGELRSAARRVARELERRGVLPEQRVAVCGARAPELIAAILGVLEVGAAYVPLDPGWPRVRRDQVLGASGARCLLYGGDAADALPPAGSLSIGELLGRALDPADELEPPTRPLVHPEQAAYVIYTSGSTGQPKGVVVSRGALSAYVEGMLARFALPSSASFGMVSTLAADLGHTVLFGALCSGRSLHLISNACAADPDQFADYMARHRVGALKIVPSHFSGLLDAARPEDVIPEVGLILGGEASTWHLVELIRRHKPRVRVFNHYGPTETTVGVLTHEVSNAHAGQTVPIGRPLPHARAVILDAGLNPCAVGVIGELYLGGHGVARGYDAAPALTAERFVPDPSPAFAGARLYRSGDRARYLAGGEIEFLGRGDQQVKIRGYRVELEEIAAALRRQSGVKAAAVIARAPAEHPSRPRVLAYYVPDAAAPASPDGLLLALSSELPEYMWPAACMPLGSLPVTENGKLDTRALPDPERAPEPTAEPRTEREARLAAIWAEVLGRDSVGIDDNFFELGGDSILSLKIIARAAKSGIRLSPKQLFEKQTIARLAVDAAPGSPSPSPTIALAPREQPLPLSHAQQRLWFLWQLDRESTAYNVVRAVRLSGPLDGAALARSFSALVARHESLRTRFRVVLGEARQCIAEAAAVPIMRIDLRPHPAEHREREARRRTLEQARLGFDLEAGPLLRVSLLEFDDEDHVLLIALHHIAADGWSTQVLLDDFAHLYAAERSGKASTLAELPVQYADYAVWQRSWLAGERQAKLLEYWTERLGTDHPVLELPTDRPRPAVASQQSGRWTLDIDEELTRALCAVARREQTTVAMLLLAVFKLLLHRYTGVVDLRVGVVTANRRSPELEKVVGFFVNLLVVRTHLGDNPSFAELLARVKEATLDAYAHQDLPFEQLVEALRPERSLSHNPLFQVAFNHHARATDVRAADAELRVTPLDWHDPPSQFDLILYAEEGERQLGLTFAYSRELFEPESIRALAGHYENLLRGAVERPHAAAHRLVIASDEEQRALSAANATEAAFPRGVCLHELLARQARRTPEAVAISDGRQTLTYGELHARSNRLARKLRAMGVGPERLVGVCVERSLEMVVALLAILEAGGAYVPLDPEYPAARLAHMVKDSGLSLLITEDRWLSHLPGGLDNVLCLDRDLGQLERFSNADLPVEVHPQSLAYCMYTSGSTGQPKGVGVTHESLVNFLTSMADQPGIDSKDRVLALTSLSFDIAGLELYLPLLVGACIVLVDRDTARDPARLLDTVLRERISVLQATPSTWQALAPELRPGVLLECKALCGGEALAPDLAARLQRHFEEVWNVYGPTETTIWSSRHRLTGSSPEPLVGTPIANTSIFVLDAALGQAPERVKGELYIGGLGVARGYHGRPGLTAERFVPNPFARRPGERMYRTGDVGQRRRGGALACLGRTDQQVKIRGHRIELGEIEARLSLHPLVSQAAVIAREGDSGKRLVAYVVPSPNAGDDLQRRLREYLGETLPDYMVPGQIALLEQLPLTANGKLDRQRLPEPQRPTLEYLPPQSRHEERLAQIWQEVLKVERVGGGDNFFELGGDSIISLEVVHRARGLGLDVSARDLFQQQTLAALAQRAAERERASGAEGATAARAVTPEQRRLLDTFAGRVEACANARVFVAHDSLTAEQLERALQALVVQHDALRLRFRRSAGGWQQEQEALEELERRWRDEPLVQSRAGVVDLLEQRWVEAARQSLSLEQGALVRAVWVEDLLGARRIVLLGHELVMDDASWRVVLDDLRTACAQLRAGQRIELPRRTAAFEDWARRLRQSATVAGLATELAYWRERVFAADAAATVLGRGSRAVEPSAVRATLSARLSPKLTAGFLDRGRKAYQCEADELLLTALSLALCELGREPSVLVSVERRPVTVAFEDLDVSRTVGQLTTRFPLLLTPAAEAAGVGEAIKSVKEQSRAVPRAGVGFGLLKYSGVPEVDGWQGASLPVVSFQYAGALPAGAEASVAQWPHGLMLVATLDRGELLLRGSFDPGVLDGERVRQLMRAYRARLEALIVHCSEQAAGGLTPSDVVGIALDQRALEALLDDIV